MNIGICNSGCSSGTSSFLGVGCPTDYGITAQSAPDYDKWGPDCAWSADNWITWHKLMVADHGKEAADSHWVAAYDQASYGSKEIGYSTGNTAFKQYVKAQGLDKKSTILSKVYRAEVGIDSALEPVKNVGGAITNITAGAESAAKSADTLAKWFPYIVLAGVALLGLLIWNKKSLNVAV